MGDDAGHQASHQYAMTLNRIPITGPFKGIISDIPPPDDPTAFDDMLNFFCRKGRIQTRPRFNPFTPPPDGSPIEVLTTFLDVNGIYHTLVLTELNAFFMTAGPVYNQLTYPTGITNLGGTGLPYGWANILGRVYFANGSVPLVYVDGSVNVRKTIDAPGTCLYMTVNNAQLIIAGLTEPEPGVSGSIPIPIRVRWSASGNPNEWNPTVDYTAGFNDLVDVPDIITGLATLGPNTYVFRTNGITIMFPTSVGLSPYAFEDYSLLPKGIGNVFPYSLALAGNQVVFVSEPDIMLFSGSGFQPLAVGKVKKRIYADLSNALANNSVTGTFLTNLGLGFDFPSYWLNIPGVNVTWVYSFDDNCWVRINSSKGWQTAAGTVFTS